MSKPRPVSLDYHLIADDGDVVGREPPVAQGSDLEIPIALDASPASANAVFDGAVNMAALDQEIADDLLIVVPVADEGEFLDAELAGPTGGGASSVGWNLEAGPAGLPEWHILTTDGTILTAEYNPRIGSSDHDAFDWGLDIAPSAGSGHESSSDLIFLDFESYARPESPGGGGGGGGGNGGGKNKDSGDGSGETSDPGVMSEYTSGQGLNGFAISDYNIEIDFKGSWAVDLQQDFIDAAEWISSFIVGDIADVFYRGQIIDDVKITAELVEIDGVGKILGQAGPTAIRTADYLPATGVMEFDVADAENYDAMGLFGDIVFHEMMHTIGFGSIWDLKGLVAGSAGTEDPTFTGAGALSEYQVLDAGATGVPLEWEYGAGTNESHWHEGTFENEIMTGIIDGANYLSDMTIASLEDLGYDTTWV